MILPGLKAGSLLAGRYRVEGVLGEGGMGVVVRARHLELDELVAVKLLRPHLAEHPEARPRFLREARAAVKIKSEHVARVLDVGRLDNDTPFLVMELLEGSNLGAATYASGGLGVDDAVDYTIQAAVGLAEAHALGIVHRDVKPSNLFLTQRANGQPLVKVLDFGISKVLGAGVEVLTRTDAAMGSTPYMSPEQMESARDVDARTDVYALGVTLYELLSARRPFEADSTPQVCALVLKGAATPLDEARTGLPAGLSQVVHKALAPERADRFQSVTAFAAALAPFAPARTADALAALKRVAAAAPAPPREADLATAPTSLPTAATAPLFNAAPRGAMVGDEAPAPARPSVPTTELPPVSAPGTPRPAAGSPARKRWLDLAGALAVGAIAAVATWRYSKNDAPPTPSATPRAGTTASRARGAVVASLKYLDAPKTASPEAAREFELGALANHEGDNNAGAAHLRRALAADPNLTVAHLWLAVCLMKTSPDEARRELATAWNRREHLTEYERALAGMTEALIAPDSPDYVTCRERSARAVERWPDDPLMLNNLAYSEMHAGRVDRAVMAAERALALDPEHFLAMANLAHYFTVAGRIDDALAVLDRCLRLHRSAASCLTRRLALRDAAGACAAYETDARQLALAAPNDMTASTSLANALAATGKPEAAVREALEHAWAVAPEADRDAIGARDRAALAVLRGDLAGALREIETARSLPLHGTLPQRFQMVTRLRLGVLGEIGRISAAVGEARALGERLPVLSGRLNAATLSMSFDPVPLLADAGIAGGALVPRDWGTKSRDAWIDEWTRTLGARNPLRAYLWIYGWAAPARTAADATAALDQLTAFGAVPTIVPTIAGRASIGRTYLLAGNAGTAAIWLGAAARACTPVDDPIGWVSAHVDLGRALEANGDPQGACRAYAFVTARWGAAKPPPGPHAGRSLPGSTSSDAAKTRLAALNCPR